MDDIRDADLNDTDYLQPSEVKSEELRILLSFDSICKEHAFRYSLAYGTLIGAVRHKGFIPWDDDIDVYMPRPDYDKLVSMRDDPSVLHGYALEPFRGTTFDDTPYVKLVDPSIVVMAEVEAQEQRLWIDIFPVDGLPDDDAQVAEIYQQAKRLRTALTIAGVKASSGSTVLKKIGKALLQVPLSVPGVTASCARKLDALGRAIPYGSTKWVGAVTEGEGPCERMALADFERQVMMEFEGHSFSCMSCWDANLRGIYGDYMQLPPENQRVSHGVKAWRVAGNSK